MKEVDLLPRHLQGVVYGTYHFVFLANRRGVGRTSLQQPEAMPTVVTYVVNEDAWCGWYADVFVEQSQGGICRSCFNFKKKRKRMISKSYETTRKERFRSMMCCVKHMVSFPSLEQSKVVFVWFVVLCLARWWQWFVGKRRSWQRRCLLDSNLMYRTVVLGWWVCHQQCYTIIAWRRKWWGKQANVVL